MSRRWRDVLCAAGYMVIFALCMGLLAWRAWSVPGIQGGTAEPVERTLVLPVEKDAWADNRVEIDAVIPEPEPTDWHNEATYIARTLYGEARGCSAYEQEQVAWCILNRVDDERFPDSIQEVVTQRGQFYGYSPEHPVWDSLYALAWDVLDRWEKEKTGEESGRNLGREYLYFSGYNGKNHFRTES